MIEIIKSGTHIDFVSKIKYITTFSVIIMIVALYGIFNKMNYGVDFRGGAEVQIKFQKSISLGELRETLSTSGFQGVSVQSIGNESENEVLIKVQANEGELNLVTERIQSTLAKSFQGNQADVEKVDIVGPKAGNELRLSALKAMLWAILAIMAYVAIRFDFRFAPGVIASLIHDVVIVAGVISFTSYEFSLQTVAALLAIIGYSVNDTVVVYDRIRENEERDQGLTLSQHVNNAINETLSRTLLTSVATLLVSFTMFFIGGGAIKDFFFTLIVGIIFGTYSSIYVASAVTIFCDRFFKKNHSETNRSTPTDPNKSQVKHA